MQYDSLDPDASKKILKQNKGKLFDAHKVRNFGEVAQDSEKKYIFHSFINRNVEKSVFNTLSIQAQLRKKYPAHGFLHKYNS